MIIWKTFLFPPVDKFHFPFSMLKKNIGKATSNTIWWDHEKPLKHYLATFSRIAKTNILVSASKGIGATISFLCAGSIQSTHKLLTKREKKYYPLETRNLGAHVAVTKCSPSGHHSK